MYNLSELHNDIYLINQIFHFSVAKIGTLRLAMRVRERQGEIGLEMTEFEKWLVW